MLLSVAPCLDTSPFRRKRESNSRDKLQIPVLAAACESTGESDFAPIPHFIRGKVK